MDRHKVSLLIDNVVLSVKAIMLRDSPSGQKQGELPDWGHFCVPLWCFAFGLDISIKASMLRYSTGGQLPDKDQIYPNVSEVQVFKY